MKILRRVPSKRSGVGAPTVVAIGNFDGVHRGHRATIRRLVRESGVSDATPTIVTFDPHPQKVLRGEAPPVLTKLDRKLELLEEQGVAQTWVIPFTPGIDKLEPEDFVADVLVAGLSVKGVVVGADFRFGRFARGDVPMLRNLGERYGFLVRPSRIVELEGRRVSSTAIRHAVSEGDLPWANKALGRPFEIRGVIEKGAGRGADLGYPTANLQVTADQALPKRGIYAGHASSGLGDFKAAISVGSNPTFGDNPVSVEAFLLDFDGDLYGETCTLRFEQWLRDEKKFRSARALGDAIEADVAETRRRLKGR